ncbi:MAG: penicillin-binding transpeptidase domain-containing protein [Phycisphaerae bacterium]
MYKFRIKIFLALIGIVFSLMILRLGYLQIVRGEEYRREAAEALRHVELAPSLRGQILDRNNRILAMEYPCFDFSLDYRFMAGDESWIRREVRRIESEEGLTRTEAETEYKERSARTWQLARRLASMRGEDLQKNVNRICSKIRTIREIVGMRIREERQVHAVVPGLRENISLDGTVGAAIVPNHRRHYEHDDIACHILGVTSEISAEKQRRLNEPNQHLPTLERKRKNYLIGDRIGTIGVERMCEQELRGTRGYRRFKRKDGRRVVTEYVPPVHGRDVQLTLDIKLQERVTKLLSGVSTPACAVVMDVETNEILALVSVPTYNLNTYRQNYKYLVQNERLLPLLHRAVARRYPPGSTAKPISGIAGIESGRVGLHTRWNCRGYMYRPGQFRCWNRHGHGDEDLVEAIMHSCNVYFYHAGETVGLDYLAGWFQKFGCGEKPGTGLPEEKSGLVPTSSWIRSLPRSLRRTPHETPADARFTAIGQGYLDVTPLHVGNAMATLARGGLHREPRLIRRVGPASQPGTDTASSVMPTTSPNRPENGIHLEIAPATVEAIHEGMYKVCNFPGSAEEGRGTAYKVFHRNYGSPLGVKVCGKTGTAQTAPQRWDSNDNGRIDGGDEIVRQGHTAWFSGFAPYRDPQIAIAVMVEYVEPGGGGSKNAAPLAREIIRMCKEMGYIR